MASVAEQLAANINFGVFSKATELKKRLWFTLGCLIVYRLGTYIPLPGIDPRGDGADLRAAARRHPGHVQHVLGRRPRAHVDLRAGHPALHLRLDHPAADDRDLADARGAEEGGRERPQEDQPVHPLPDRGSGRVPGLGAGDRARGDDRARGLGGGRSGHVLPPDSGDHHRRRHPVPDVARRADHRPRHRQRHLADHLRRHHRPAAACDREPARARPHRRHVAGVHHPLPGAGGRRDRVHRLHGAGAASHPGPVPEAAAGQPRVRRRELAPAAEAEHRGRDPGDLRELAAAAAGDRRRLRRRRRGRTGSSRSAPRSATASRCTSRSTSR